MFMINRFSASIRYCAIAVLTLLFAGSAAAEIRQGKALVTAIKGSVTYSYNKGFWKPLKKGDVLRPGATIKTAQGSSVDFFMDQNGEHVSLNEESTLNLEKLSYEEQLAGVPRVETILDLQRGELIGHAQQLASGSSYKVRTQNGLANIGVPEPDVKAAWIDYHPKPPPTCRTRFYISYSKGTIHVLEGKVNLDLQMFFTNHFDDIRHSLSIGPGQSFFMPKKLGLFEFRHLHAVDSPDPLKNLNSFTLFDIALCEVTVKETFIARLIVNPKTGLVRKLVKFPPEIEVVSE
jgi:hypothetical protein